MRYLLAVLALLLAMNAVVSFAQSRVPANLDCSAKALREAERKYQEVVKPLLATVADSYNDKTEELQSKERERAIVLRDWMRMRCTCKVAGMSVLEKTLCQALSPEVRLSDPEACLVRN